MRIKATAPGKLILLGEYAVLEGAPALVMAVDRFAEITLQSTSSNECIVSAPTLGISRLPFVFDAAGKIAFNETIGDETLRKLSFFLVVLEKAQSLFSINLSSLPAFEVFLDTSQFFNAKNQKLGLGSSAALTAALLSALCQFQDTDFDIDQQRERIFKTSLQIHRKAQNNIGSGIDITASVFGGALKYQLIDMKFKALPIYEKLTIPGDLYILFVWTGASASTTQFVQKVNEFKLTQPSAFNEIIKRMQGSSISGIEAIQQRDIDQLMQAISQYFKAMNDLGEQSEVPIISKAHREIHELVCEQGGVYKPSGAGGGDIGIAFCNSPAEKARISKKLMDSGFQIVNLQLTENGVHSSML